MRLLGFTDSRHDIFASPIYATGEPAEVVSVSDTSGPIKKYASLLRRGTNAIQNHDPDVLLSNHPGRLGFAVALLGAQYNVPTVIKLGGNLWRTNYDKLAEHWTDGHYLSFVARCGQITLNRVVCLQAAGFLVVSEALKCTVIERTRRPEREVQVVHIPVKFEQYANGNRVAGRRCLNVGDAPLILSVTNLNFRGKFEGVCQAIDELEPILRKRGITYVIAGGGRYLGALREYIETEVSPIVRKRIRLPGFVGDIANVYAAADLFVYLSNIDGYPNVILEAQAAGLPVVANAAHGMLEQIDDKQNGALVDTSNEGELQGTVRELLDDPAERERLGKRAQRTVRKRNSPKAIGEQMIRAVEKIINK